MRPFTAAEGADAATLLGRWRLERVAEADLPLVNEQAVHAWAASRVAGDPPFHDGLVSGPMDAFALWHRGLHPLEGTREWMVGAVAASDDEALGRLLAGLLAEARRAPVDLVRLELPAASPATVAAARDSGFVGHYAVMRKVVAPDSAYPEVDWWPTRPQDRSFALHCLTAAVRNALVLPAPDERVREVVAQRYGDLGDGRYTSLVAGEGGQPRVHALLEFQASWLCGEPESSIVDMYADPEHRGAGWSRKLGACVEAYLAERGVTRVEATRVVGLDEQAAEQLRRNLAGGGWWDDRVALVAPVSARAAAYREALDGHA